MNVIGPTSTSRSSWRPSSTRSVSSPRHLGLHLGFDRLPVEGALSAPSAAEVFGPEVALLDLRLPDMDGFELARRFREHPRLHGALIVAVTGYGQASDRERTTAAGFDHHFVKPVAWDALLAAIEVRDQTEGA